MRLNKFLAQNTQLSRRTADAAITEGQVTINGKKAEVGSEVSDTDVIKLCGDTVRAHGNTSTVLLLHKPVGYVCSRNGQGSRTVYELLPEKYQNTQTVGRLDKDSSGLLVMTDDGQLAYELTHPKFEKEKLYEITLDKELSEEDIKRVGDGIELKDGLSKLEVTQVGNVYIIKMREGRNRQIRRTFSALGYNVTSLHRTDFGSYRLDGLPTGKFRIATAD